MPAGKGKPAGGYRAGAKGSYGCDGYPTVSADGTVHGCHPTKARAAAQARAIWASTAKKFVTNVEKAMIAEGDYVMFLCEEDEIKVGQVEYVMTEGTYGLAGSEYAMEATPEDPVLSIRIFEEEDGAWEATENIHAHKASEAVKIESLMVSMDVVREMQSSSSPAETMMDPMDAYDNSMGKSSNLEDEEMDKAKKPNYGDFIQPRSGGSDPADAQLYARILREAKDKFDVYPSAVANSWVVQEYKRRGGTYKSEKRERSMATRERLAETGAAMPDGSYPIVTEQDLRNAIQSVGRAKNYAAAKQHIITRARALGMTDMLPEDWKNSTSKGQTGWGGSVFDLNPFVK